MEGATKPEVKFWMWSSKFVTMANNKSSNKEGWSGDVALNIALCVVAVSATLLQVRALRRTKKQQEDITQSLQHILDSIKKKQDTVPASCPPFLQKRGLLNLSSLSAHERKFVEDVVDPDSMKVDFYQIGGLNETKKKMWQLCVLPLKRPELFRGNKLIQPPSGILLHGKPGTGKTLLAKALAKESGAAFFEVKTSKIIDMLAGEGNKNIAALFSLARKLAPSILFIDEIDALLSPRGIREQNWETQQKAGFLTAVDGLTSENSGVILLGATNLPQNIDAAILRRMPQKFEIPLPDKEGRLQILKLILEEQDLDAGIVDFLPQLAKESNGFSGSDLKELCRAAVMQPINDATLEMSHKAVASKPWTASTKASDGSSFGDVDRFEIGSVSVIVRPVTVEDFRLALEGTTKPSAH